MNAKTVRIIFWIATGLLSAMMLMSAGMYFFNYEEISKTFDTLGYPGHVIYPLAVAKILAVVAILTRKSATLAEWAYAGLFFDFVLALMAHLDAGDGEFGGAVIALVLLFTSYFMGKRMAMDS
ncbi:MAG: DoxX family protein [Bacteroidota bacterium]